MEPRVLSRPFVPEYTLADQAFMFLRQKLWPVDDARVGKLLDTVAIDLSPELVAEYARRIGVAPLSRPPATLLYAHAHREVESWYLPQLAGNLHLRQEWEFIRPTSVGERLVASRQITDRYALPNGRTVVVCEVRITRDGELVAVSRTHQSFATHTRKRDGRPDKAQEMPAAVPELAVRAADTLQGPGIRLDQIACDAYVGMGADGRQLRTYHNWWPAARVLGFPKVVVQGTHGVCLVNDLIERHFGSLVWHRGGSLDLQFVRPVWLGDEVWASGRIRPGTMNTGDASQTAQVLDVWLVKQGGVVAIQGTASVPAAAEAAAATRARL